MYLLACKVPSTGFSAGQIAPAASCIKERISFADIFATVFAIQLPNCSQRPTEAFAQQGLIALRSANFAYKSL